LGIKLPLFSFCLALVFQPVSTVKAQSETGQAVPSEPIQNTISLRTGRSFRTPTDVTFNLDSIFRTPVGRGDNWCTTWAADNSQITSMDDGAWLNATTYHNMLYRIEGGVDEFSLNPLSSRSRVSGYPLFLYGNEDQPGWFGYGVVAIDDTIYSMVSRTPSNTFQGPFQGVKMLKSTDNGQSWYRVNKNGDTRLVTPTDDVARNSTAVDEMFFWREFGKLGKDSPWYLAYPFSWVSFVQNGKAGEASPDGYIYIYAPESSLANQLLLARVKEEEFEQRANWEYFKQWNGNTPIWTTNIQQRGNVLVYTDHGHNSEDHHEFADKKHHEKAHTHNNVNESGFEDHRNENNIGWYSWLPSVVWNQGLGVYIMVNGGTYVDDNWQWSDLSGSLGLWYSENPYGPWTNFYYTDHFIIPEPGDPTPENRTYQPKLSPKWISDDGEEMVLIWSDSMANEFGQTHTVNYRWNQMKINLVADEIEVVFPTLQLPNNQWQLISLPGDSGSSNTVRTIFGDELPMAGYGVDWNLFVLNEFGEYRSIDPDEILAPGVGYWIIQLTGNTVGLNLPEGATKAAVTPSAACSREEGCFEIPLRTSSGIRWNLIGAPVSGTVNSDLLRAVITSEECGNSGCTLDQAESHGYLHNKMWRYSATSGYEEIDSEASTSPWDGLWFPALGGAENKQPKLLFPVE
jgi:hypothetical protein